jgi:hypothetical protein
MIDAIVKVMIEVLFILAIATKEIKENRASELILAKNMSSQLSIVLETYLKKLVGKTDIEDALLKLENAILEETRMAAAESLKGIQGLQDRMRGVEGMLEGVGDMLQGFDERMKDISQMGINSAQITVQLVIFTIYMSLLSDAENAASQTANDADTVTVIGLATVPGADGSIKIKDDDDKVHGLQDMVEGVRDGTRNVDNEQGIIEDIGARVIDGARVILKRYLNHPERLYCFRR